VIDWSRENRARRLSMALLLVAVFCGLWVIVEIIAPAARVPAPEVVFVRYGTHLLFMATVYGTTRGTRLFRTSRIGLQAVRSLLMVVMPLSFLGALKLLKPNTALAVFWIAPVLAVMLGDPRKVRPAQWGAILLGFLGVLLVLRPSPTTSLLGVGCAMTMAASFALYQHLTHSLEADGVIVNVFHTALWAFLALAPLAIHVWRVPTAAGWLVLAAVGVLGFFAWCAFDLALRLATSEVIATALFTQPLFALGASWLLTGSPITAWMLAGSCLVVAAVWLAIGASATRHRSSASRPDGALH
jgi:drug/metabolite transporter (DMT)-like permease